MFIIQTIWNKYLSGKRPHVINFKVRVTRTFFIMSHINLNNDDFRDHLYNESKDGKRLWIYPGRIIGQLYRLRTYFSILLLVVFFGMPWLEWKNQSLFLFNIIERRFIFFGVPFFPQDFHIVAVGIVCILLFISLFTVLFGRIWCGWACPQTIFMEMFFRKIDYWIEGDDKAQRRLDEAPWNLHKILLKSLKHGLYLLFSFIISNTFLLYILGKKAWLTMILEPPALHTKGLLVIILFTGVFYFIFDRFREMVCMVICPYGRLQGVLLDNKSILVQYDSIRGEQKGDCIDCHWCVRVCPTGIDIRNGSNQMECIGCTSCIDACDEVMIKIHKPKGLIRYDSVHGLQTGEKLHFTARIGAYVSALVLIMGILVVMLITRNNFEVTILRTPGMTYQVEEKTKMVSNLYQMDVLNKSLEAMQVIISVEKPFEIVWVGKPIRDIEQGNISKGEFFIRTKMGTWTQGKKLQLFIRSKNGTAEIIKTSFIQPDGE